MSCCSICASAHMPNTLSTSMVHPCHISLAIIWLGLPVATTGDPNWTINMILLWMVWFGVPSGIALARPVKRCCPRTQNNGITIFSYRVGATTKYAQQPGMQCSRATTMSAALPHAGSASSPLDVNIVGPLRGLCLPFLALLEQQVLLGQLRRQPPVPMQHHLHEDLAAHRPPAAVATSGRIRSGSSDLRCSLKCRLSDTRDVSSIHIADWQRLRAGSCWLTAERALQRCLRWARCSAVCAGRGAGCAALPLRWLRRTSKSLGRRRA